MTPVYIFAIMGCLMEISILRLVRVTYDGSIICLHTGFAVCDDSVFFICQMLLTPFRTMLVFMNKHAGPRIKSQLVC